MATFGTSAEFSRVLNATTAEFWRKEEINILRKRKLLAALQSKGRITYNHEGDQLIWPVRIKRTPLTPYSDMGEITTPRQNKWRNANLDWRGYYLSDSVTEKEKEMNKGRAAIVKYIGKTSKMLADDAKDGFGEEFYIDGNAAGNEERLHGFPSFLGHTGSGASGGFVGVASDTYGGLSTTLGGLGGSWTGNWPAGTGDPQYDAWSPLIVDYTDTAWTASTKTWPNTCLEALRYGIINSQRNSTMLGLILLEKELYYQFLQALDDRERIITERSRSNSLLVKLGFGDVVNFDGVDVSWEYGVPATQGYGFDFDAVEVCSLMPQLFNPKPMDFALETLSDRYVVNSWLNMKCNPRSFVLFDNIT